MNCSMAAMFTLMVDGVMAIAVNVLGGVIVVVVVDDVDVPPHPRPVIVSERIEVVREIKR